MSLAYFFLVLSSVTNLKEQLLGSKRFIDSHCGRYSIFSVTPKRMLKIQIFEKKGICFSGKNYLNNFSGNIEYDKPQRTFLWIQKALWQLLWK